SVAGYHDTPLPDNLSQLQYHDPSAMQRKRLEMAGFLIRQGAKIEAKDKDGGTPLLRASQQGKPEMVAFLIARGAHLQVRDRYGYPPLHWAAFNGMPAVVRILLDHGADVNARDTQGRTPLQLAETSAKQAADQKGIQEIIQHLEQAAR